MRQQPNVLLVEDSQSLAAIYLEYLSKEPYKLEHMANGTDAKISIEQSMPDLILLDLKLPDMSGEDILKWIQQQGFPCSVIVITAHGSVDIAVDVMRLGAIDFLEKPFDANRLKITIDNALKQTKLKHLVDDLQHDLKREHYHGFIGNSLSMQAVYRIIDAAAPSKASIFITGESGTGKEVCAEAIHKQSQRSDQPFIALNCGAIPHELMESEIFGHKKGAFTGAVSEREGAASMANNGVLFLDEIGEMDMDLQTKLLRFIQTGTFQKVGSSKIESVDIRFICATNKDPLTEIAAGNFREDLYYRLHVIPIPLPPLRDRGEDILQIAKQFLNEYNAEENKNFTSFSAEVEVIISNYEWPGNVRQLQNVIRNIVVLHNDTQVKTAHLPPPIDTSLGRNQINNITPTFEANNAQVVDKSSMKTLAIVERETIEQAIAICDDNIPMAAALLDVSPSTIYRKKQAWE